MADRTSESRDRNVLEIVKGLLFSEVAFQEIYKNYKGNCPLFGDIGNWVDDKGQSPLYNLKELSHAIFRHDNTDSFHKMEWLLDLAIGSIFHEGMKLRESIYQLEVYRPRYLQFKVKAGPSVYEKDYAKQFERIISRAEQGLVEGMEEMRSLFQDTMAQLFDFIRQNAKNVLLVRFLLEHPELLRRVFGSRTARGIFGTMFERGLLDAYMLAGRSYLQSEHYDLSTRYFKKALKLAPRTRDLRLLLIFSLGMKAYYQNAFARALAYFEQLHPLVSANRLEKEYLKKAEEACLKISLELKEERRHKISRKAEVVAGRLKKCYDASRRSR